MGLRNHTLSIATIGQVVVFLQVKAFSYIIATPNLSVKIRFDCLKGKEHRLSPKDVYKKVGA